MLVSVCPTIWPRPTSPHWSLNNCTWCTHSFVSFFSVEVRVGSEVVVSWSIACFSGHFASISVNEINERSTPSITRGSLVGEEKILRWSFLEWGSFARNTSSGDDHNRGVNSSGFVFFCLDRRRRELSKLVRDSSLLLLLLMLLFCATIAACFVEEFRNFGDREAP